MREVFFEEASLAGNLVRFQEDGAHVRLGEAMELGCGKISEKNGILSSL